MLLLTLNASSRFFLLISCLTLAPGHPDKINPSQSFLAVVSRTPITALLILFYILLAAMLSLCYGAVPMLVVNSILGPARALLPFV